MGRFKLLFEWRDLWVGMFINTDKKYLYICLLPCLVIRFYYGKIVSRKGCDQFVLNGNVADYKWGPPPDCEGDGHHMCQECKYYLQGDKPK